MKIHHPLPKLLLISFIMVVGGCFAMSFAFRASWGAKEYPAAERERWLADDLRERFNWPGLPTGSLERVWVSGGKDRSYLLRIRLAPDQFAELREAVLAVRGDNVESDDRDDLSLCPFGFATPDPQVSEKTRLPEWWEAASLQKFDGLFWRANRYRYWFGYDSGRQLLFLYRIWF